MSATIARQQGRVQLEQSDLRLALNMAKLTNEGFSRTRIDEMKYLIKKPRAEVREEGMRGLKSPGHKEVKAAMERHPAMLHQHHTSRCLPCQNCTAKNLQTGWRRKGTGAPPPALRRQLMTSLPGTPPAPTGNNSGAQSSQMVNLLAGYAYSHTSCTCAEFSNLDASAQDSQHNTDFDPDTLTDGGTSTGLYTIYCVVMQLTSIW